MDEYIQQLQVGIAEMKANVERLKEEIRHLSEQRNALKRGNLELYLKLTQPDF